MILSGTVKLYFEELGHRNLTAQIGCLYVIVLSQCKAKKFVHNSISACEFATLYDIFLGLLDLNKNELA